MKGLSLIFVASFLFLTASCNDSAGKAEPLIFEDDNMQIVFLSNESDNRHEAAYYDAIIELKKEFPAEINNMVVFTAANAKKYYSTYDIDNSPAILVIQQDKVMAKINGSVPKDQIVGSVSKILSYDLIN
ncbi:small peptidoglycan-associated lipoprotein [Mesobacillus harenae]|uniref:small peptidoglycan-associated lipoprotein n=1 Tax=Mesobacillus harenae TaxID=2213203 RepID=UPI001F553F60|nr:small peptidoglycan-associated lipoprotein [Mesobacillus harenae]